MRLRTGLLVLAWLALAPALAQDNEEADADTAAETGQPAEPADAEEDEPVPADIDDRSYLDIDEEDFRPSEEIPTDQSITFPTDI